MIFSAVSSSFFKKIPLIASLYAVNFKLCLTNIPVLLSSKEPGGYRVVTGYRFPVRYINNIFSMQNIVIYVSNEVSDCNLV